MEKELICLDTSILIDYFRKQKKEASRFEELTYHYQYFSISAVTEYEIRCGINQKQFFFWEQFLQRIQVLSFTSQVSKIAAKIHQDLKRNRQQIDTPDLLIAATAIFYDAKLATLNAKHFTRIDQLDIV